MRISENYDKITGIATVTVQDHRNIFTGTAKVHPDDFDFANGLTGFDIAYLRAMIKRKKKKMSEIKAQVKYFKGLLKSWTDAYLEQFLGLHKLQKELRLYLQNKEDLQVKIKKVKSKGDN